MATLCQAILVWVDMAINMFNIGVYAKNRKNVDNLRKQIGKNRDS